MTTALITLTDEESERLRAIADRTGKSEEQLLTEAVAAFLSRSQPIDRLSVLRRARGLWKDRPDLPDLRDLRTEFERFG